MIASRRGRWPRLRCRAALFWGPRSRDRIAGVRCVAIVRRAVVLDVAVVVPDQSDGLALDERQVLGRSSASAASAIGVVDREWVVSVDRHRANATSARAVGESRAGGRSRLSGHFRPAVVLADEDQGQASRAKAIPRGGPWFTVLSPIETTAMRPVSSRMLASAQSSRDRDTCADDRVLADGNRCRVAHHVGEPARPTVDAGGRWGRSLLEAATGSAPHANAHPCPR